MDWLLELAFGVLFSYTFVRDTKYGHHANEPFSVTLQAGQCYQLQSDFYQDFSVTTRKETILYRATSTGKVTKGTAFLQVG
jgi:hypothetical protein